MLPAEIRALLSGAPTTGEWEPVFPLLTVDPAGDPRICLLSRAEIDVDPRSVPGADTVRCAVRGRRTSANLRRTGTAALQVVGADVSWTVRGRVGRTATGDGGLGVELIVTDVERDSLDIPLRPMSYLADAALAVIESWDSTAALLARLAT